MTPKTGCSGSMRWIAAVTSVPAMHARAEIGHQITEGAGLPPRVERIEAFRHTVGRGGDLIRVDRVELLLLSEDLEVPEDQRLSADHLRRHGGLCG
jgi:hypothetical protein